MGYFTEFAEIEIADFREKVRTRAEKIEALKADLKEAEEEAAKQKAAAAQALEDLTVDPVEAAAEEIRAKRLQGKADHIAADLEAERKRCAVSVAEMAGMIGKVNGVYHEQIQKCYAEIGARCDAVIEAIDRAKEIDKEHHQLVKDLYATLQGAGAPGFMAHTYSIADKKALTEDQAALVQMYQSAEMYHVFGLTGSADRLVKALKEGKNKFN